MHRSIVATVAAAAALLGCHSAPDRVGARTEAQTRNGSTPPTLLPADPALRGAATITRGPGWYAASIDAKDHSVLVEGREPTTPLADVPGAQPSASGVEHGRLTRTQGIVELSFLRDGLAITVGVECADPEGDSRCTGDAYVRELARSLTDSPNDADEETGR